MTATHGVSRRRLLHLFGVGALATALARRTPAAMLVEPRPAPEPAPATFRLTRLELFLKSRAWRERRHVVRAYHPLEHRSVRTVFGRRS